VIEVWQAAGETEALLRAIPDAQGFRAVIDEPIETPPGDTRVKWYWVLYFGPGAMNEDRIVPKTFVDYVNFQVTVAGGTEDRCLFGVGQVREALAGIEIASGLISEQPFDVGPPRIDRAVTPPRHYVPLSYRLEP